MRLKDYLGKQQIRESFWSGNNPLQKEYNELFKLLVKPEGKSDTVQGELLRAASKIGYDYYNNGFGNNWSGAWNYLKNNGPRDIADSLEVIRYFKAGHMPADGNDPGIEKAIEDITTKVVKSIIADNGQYTPNDEDMWDDQDPDEWDDKEDDD